MSTFMWALVVAFVIPIVLAQLKRWQPKIESNKLVMRLLVVAVGCVGAVVIQLTTTGHVDLDATLKAAATIIGGSEFSYQWIVKYLGDLAAPKGG